MYIRYARREVRDAVSAFYMRDLWQRRPAVAAAVLQKVATSFARAHAVVSALQVLNLNIPSAVQSAIETTTVEEQKIEQVRQQQLVSLVEVRTSQLSARQDAEVTVINAEASAQKLVIDARAAANALNITINGQKQALIATRDGLGVNNADLLEYLRVQSVLKTGASLKVSLPQPPGAF
jgi:regulator of protease activity HflC (stomatin/prohibitin superfamily)